MKKIIAASFIIMVAFTNCKKNISDPSVSVTAENTLNASASNTVCRSQWKGEIDQVKPKKTILVGDKKFIFTGYAYIPATTVNGDYFTKFNLETPACSFVNADSLTMNVSLKNPDSANTGSECNVDLYLYGSINTAHVTLVRYSNKYTALTVGDHSYTYVNALLQYFPDYSKVSLEAKNNVLSVYVKGTLEAQLDYTGLSIGMLKSILIGFKGSGFVNYVKLFNSYTNAPIMTENFGTAGKSTDTWYQ